jgi:hypothetical protein
VRIAKSSAIAASIPGVNALEPISPELVLVDPELARVARARLPEGPPRSAPAAVETTRTLLEPAPAQAPAPTSTEEVQPPSVSERQPRHVLLSPALLLVSVFVNIVLISLAVSDARVDQPYQTSTVPVRLPPEIPAVPPSRSRSPAPKTTGAKQRTAPKSQTKPTKGARAGVVHETAGAVERKVLGIVVQAPAGKLPPALIDPRTGLAKNNLQAVCRRSSARSFLCIVRPARHRPTEGLYVRYRPGRAGGSAFTWNRYRTG